MIRITYTDGSVTELDSSLYGRSPSPSDRGGAVVLLGFSITPVPDAAKWPASFQAPAYIHPEKLELDGYRVEELAGYYAQFVSVDGSGGMFGWRVPVASVELVERPVTGRLDGDGVAFK